MGVGVMSDRKPVLIDWEDQAPAAPEAAPPVPDLLPTGAAMQRAVAMAAGPRSGVGGWVLTTTLALVSFVAGLAAWDYVTGLLARSPLLGGIGAALALAFVLALFAFAIRELAAFARIARLDAIQKAAATALTANDLAGARDVVARLTALYAGRGDLSWARDRLAQGQAEALDADALLHLAEITLIAPLDKAAEAEVQSAARQVATVTALVPLAFADVIAALTANLRMIRRIAEVYGGRGGILGSWRLTRAVMTHLVATGAVAFGDDMISSVAGGGLLSKLSRRFGEGVVNGALTARVGVAAIEVCRPLPFRALPRPSVSGIVGRALRGLFGTSQEKS
jgi:putative membrane protein